MYAYKYYNAAVLMRGMPRHQMIQYRGRHGHKPIQSKIKRVPVARLLASSDARNKKIMTSQDINSKKRYAGLRMPCPTHGHRVYAQEDPSIPPVAPVAAILDSASAWVSQVILVPALFTSGSAKHCVDAAQAVTCQAPPEH